jgi:hypothetical protein
MAQQQLVLAVAVEAIVLAERQTAEQVAVVLVARCPVGAAQQAQSTLAVAVAVHQALHLMEPQVALAS